MSLGLNRNDRLRLRDPMRLRSPLDLNNQSRTSTRLSLPGTSDNYSGPRSTELTRTTPVLSSDTTSRMLQGNWPTTGYQSTQALGSTAWGGGDRLDSPAKIKQYIEQRQKDLPPTAQSLEQIAKEVAARGGTIAIATHAGGALQSDDAIVLEDGSTIDIIGSVGGPDAKWQWLHHGQSYGATYDPNREVIDPATGQKMKFGEFLTSKGKPVPPYVPLIDDGSGGGGGGIDHMSGWVVDSDKTKNKNPQDDAQPPVKTYKPMAGFDTAKLNDPNDKSGMYFFARWMQDHNLPVTKESLEKFIAENPDWEMNGDMVRIKPEALSKYGADEAAGQWHRAIGNGPSGPQWTFDAIDKPATTTPATTAPAATAPASMFAYELTQRAPMRV